MKSIFASKTLWIQVIGGTLTVLSMLNTFMPPTAAPYIAIATQVLTAINRILSGQQLPVSLTGK